MFHEIRNELDIIIVHAHFSRNLKTSILESKKRMKLVKLAVIFEVFQKLEFQELCKKFYFLYLLALKKMFQSI